MKKKVLLIGIVLVVGLMICACGTQVQTESPLKKTFKSISKYAKKTGKLKLGYDKEKERLDISFYPGADIDKFFNVLSKNVKDNAIGILYFRTYFDVQDDEKDKICERIGKLDPKSVMVFGMDVELIECGEHSWTNILPKTDILYIPNAATFYDYKDANSKKNFESVKTVWKHDTGYGSICNFPNCEEVGIYATVESDDDRASTHGKVYSTYGSYSYPTVAQFETVTGKNGKVKKVKAKPEPFEFDESFDEPDEFYALKDCKKLKRITIAPCFEKYKLGNNASSYLFGISNVRGDIMINKPYTKLAEDDYITVDEYIKTNSKITKQEKNLVVHQFLGDEVKSVYKKAKKYKKKNKKIKINDKALVYLAQPGESNYKKKRIYHSEGRVLDSSDIGYKVKLPEKAHDYRYFVYVYPTYKYYGKYNKGTKAYTITYWAQVFDLNKKVAYKPSKIGSKNPEQTIRVSGIPDKYAPSISIRKIYRSIKKLWK